MAIAIVGIAFFVATKNDFLLLPEGWALYVAVAARSVILAVSAVSSVLLLRAKWPRQHDLAYLLWFLMMAVVNIPINLTRLPSGEYLGVLLSSVILFGFYYFAMRGPLWPRVLAAGVCTGTLLILLWSPRVTISPIVRNTATLGFLGLNLLGVFSARTFTEQRRKQFEAERQERQARQELAVKLSELAAKNKRVEELSRARSVFLAAMSHEFRTPMNAVIGLSDLLLDARLEAAHKAHVQTISDSARALLAILNDILDFAKIDAQKLSLSPAPFDLRRLAASVVDMLKPAAKARSIVLSLELSPALADGFLGDDARLRQVLVNLVSNAIKFTERGAVRLHVAARAAEQTDQEITIRVEDTGIGMTPETVARLFRPFEQADAGIARRYGGTGLGLTISRQIVLAMGGDIQVRSALGSGSAFFFTLRLPVAASLSGSHPTLLATRLVEQLPLAILVVDDHPINREVARVQLGRLGYQVALASDGPEALAAVAKKDYDVVFMDLQMPGMSGIETTRRIVERLAGKRLPQIIAMTASVFEEDREACRKAGMQDFLGKPVEFARLAEVLSRVAAERAGAPSDQAPLATLAPAVLEKLRQVESRGEPHFVADLCQLFLSDTRMRLPRMAAALGRGDAPELAREAHMLRAASATIGAMEMAALCERIEGVTCEGHLVGAGIWLDALVQKFPDVERALIGELRRAPDPAETP